MSALTTAVDKLLEQHPILQGTVPEPHTPHPRIELNTEIRASNIVQTGTLNASVSDILEHALTTGAGFNIRTGPLWGVNLLQAQQSAGATLVLSVHHATSDGLGAVSLLAELVRHINTAPTPSASNNQDLLLTLPPTIESTIDIRPGFLALIYVIFTELLVPLLPQALQPRKPAPYWPLPLSNSPIIYAPRVTHFKLSEELVNNLKNIGREHSVRTLHPLLHTIALFALQHTIDRTAATQVKTVTPMSERSSAAGHPSSTGNYVAGHTEFFNIAPTSDFWDLARLYAHSLADPKARQRARAELGMLTYVPNPEKMPEHNKSGWEVFFGGKLMGPEPLGASFELSNLGVVKEELEGVEEVVYAQMPSALGAALSINVSTKSQSFTQAHQCYPGHCHEGWSA